MKRVALSKSCLTLACVLTLGFSQAFADIGTVSIQSAERLKVTKMTDADTTEKVDQSLDIVPVSEVDLMINVVAQEYSIDPKLLYNFLNENSGMDGDQSSALYVPPPSDESTKDQQPCLRQWETDDLPPLDVAKWLRFYKNDPCDIDHFE